MLLYHGSTAYVLRPEIREGNKGLDFGTGFYTTTSYEQAKRWAKNKMRREEKEIGYVTAYEFDYEAAMAALQTHTFEKADFAWLQFVTMNRAKIVPVQIGDLSIGPVADDDTARTIHMYEDGLYTVEETLRRLKTENLKDQWVFHTDKGLAFLRYLHHDTVRKEK